MRQEYLPWMSLENYPYSADLMIAFVAGNLQRQFKSQNFDPKPYHGLRRVLEVYDEIRQKQDSPPVPELNDAVP